MIVARGLVKRYGNRTVVDNVSLQVKAGQLYALLGGNGAGKTTTLHLLLGLIPPEAGEITVADQVVKPGLRPRAAFVPEVVELYPELDPVETLALFASVAGVTSDSVAIAQALSHAGLEPSHHRRRVGTFSKGMRQKVALAIAELQGARAIVLDEPTSGLDPVAAEQLLLRLNKLKQGGAAIVMSSHDVHTITTVADTLGILREGKLVLERSTEGLDAAALIALYRQAHQS